VVLAGLSFAFYLERNSLTKDEKMKVLSILVSTILATTAFASESKSASRKITSSESEQFTSYLRKIDRAQSYSCYRNLDNYDDLTMIATAKRKHKTFTDKNTGSTYVYSYLASILPMTHLNLPADAIIEQVTESHFAVTYKKPFNITMRNKAFTEISLLPVTDGEVKHLFKIIGNSYVYQSSQYDLIKIDGTKVSSIPHVRCAATEKVTEKGLLWSTNEVSRPLPIQGIDLKSNYCLGSGDTCSEIPREGMRIW
jgi:hypothetical protein